MFDDNRLFSPLKLNIFLCNYRKILGDEKVEFEIEATPWRPGTTFIVASFNANELYDITGTKKVSVVS